MIALFAPWDELVFSCNCTIVRKIQEARKAFIASTKTSLSQQHRCVALFLYVVVLCFVMKLYITMKEE